MPLSALDMEPSSPSPPPEGAAAPPPGEGTAEPVPAPEAATRSPTPHAPAKPPAASLLGVMAKSKAAGPSKAGDLTRFFEIAHRLPKPVAPPSEPLLPEAPAIPALEVESVSPPLEPPASPSEMPVAAAPPELDAPESATPAVAEASPRAEPAVPFEPSVEPSVPLLLAPPAAVEVADATVHAPVGSPSAYPTGSDDRGIPEWLKAASEDESAFQSEPAEPLNVALVPAEETPQPTVAAGVPEVLSETTSVSNAIEPAPAPAEPSPAVQAPAVADVAPIEPAVAAAEAAPAPEPAPLVPVPAPLPEPPEPTRAAVEPRPEPTPAAPRTPAFKELVDYWRSLRSGDDHPAAELIDRDLVTERWPGTLLIAYTPASQDPRGELRPGRVTRLGSACTETQSVVEAGSHSTEWMLEVARTAIVNDEPVEEQQRLATIKGVAGFRMVALPLGPPRALPTAVLCTLMPSPGAPRFGKRRVWL